jgi:hypothetical protein
MWLPPPDAERPFVEITQNLVAEVAPDRYVDLKCPGESSFSRFSSGILFVQTFKISSGHRAPIAWIGVVPCNQILQNSVSCEELIRQAVMSDRKIRPPSESVRELDEMPSTVRYVACALQTAARC